MLEKPKNTTSLTDTEYSHLWNISL